MMGCVGSVCSNEKEGGRVEYARDVVRELSDTTEQLESRFEEMEVLMCKASSDEEVRRCFVCCVWLSGRIICFVKLLMRVQRERSVIRSVEYGDLVDSGFLGRVRGKLTLYVGREFDFYRKGGCLLGGRQCAKVLEAEDLARVFLMLNGV